MAEILTIRSEHFPDLADAVIYPRLSDAKLAWLRAFEVRDLLERNLLPVRFYDVDTDAESASADW